MTVNNQGFAAVIVIIYLVLINLYIIIMPFWLTIMIHLCVLDLAAPWKGTLILVLCCVHAQAIKFKRGRIS
jgi:hypothetical protein